VRVVIQRVSRASVAVNEQVVGRINHGLVVLIGLTHDDTEADAIHVAGKIAGLRVFDDEEGKMNLSVNDVGGGLLLVSQFTLYGDIRRGRRPGFDAAASPQIASALYDCFVQRCRELVSQVATGVFQAKMVVSIENDGPVTFVYDTSR
jgi:D-aminoacyl-tRNA deacylase